MINQKIMAAILKHISKSTAYCKIGTIRRKTNNSISKNAAACILASKYGIDVYEILKDTGSELEEFKGALELVRSTNQSSKIQKTIKPTDNNHDQKTPYDYPLSEFGLDSDLVKNCKIRPPYRTAVREAALALEVRIRNLLNLDLNYFGNNLIDEAKKRGVFDRSVVSEGQGLYFMYSGAVKWIRNPSEHQQTEYTKEEAIKIVLYHDYLIKLFNKLINDNAA